MKVKCMIDKTKYNNKPQGKMIGKVQNNLKEIDIEISELAELLIVGCSFRPAFLMGKSNDDWVSQQLVALDFDKYTTIDEELNRCKELNILPSFGYTSFSHTKDQHKFRLVFALNKLITDSNEMNSIMTIFKQLFSKADEQTFHLGRLFFGGKELIHMNYGSAIDVDKLLNEYSDLILKEVSERKGVQDIYNINNINYILYPKTIPIINKYDSDDTNYNIQAIKDHNITYLKSILNINYDKIIFETQQQFFDYIFKIDLGDLLGMANPKSFNCIFHDDKNPSTNIFNDSKTGNYIYKCNSNSCGVSYNIIGIIERLGKFKSRPRAYNFIKELFNLEIMETDWQKEQKEILIENLKAIANGELEKNCPQTYKNNKNILRYLEQMHYIAMDNIYNDKFTDDEGNVLFFASTNYIADKLNISINSLNKISQKLAVLVYHHLLNKTSDTDITEQLLKESKRINAKDNNDKYKHINYFSIPSYTYNLYNDIEKQGNDWKQNKYTMKGVSREMFYRAEGKEVADRIYPQFTKITKQVNDERIIIDRTTSEKSDIRTNDIVEAIFYMIDNKGYATELEIEELLLCKYTKQGIKTQIKKSLKEILDSYNLKRVRTNNQIKDIFRIISTGYPFIIVKNED